MSSQYYYGKKVHVSVAVAPLTNEPYTEIEPNNVGFVCLYEGELKYLKAQYNIQKAGRSDPWSVMTALSGPKRTGDQQLYSYDASDPFIHNLLNSAVIPSG